MGVREMINKRKPLSAVIAATIIVATVAIAFVYLRGNDGVFGGGAKAFYTVDDGKTWFVADAEKLPPFQHDGKTAYRCYLFTTDGGKTKFVSHLERYTPQGKKQAEEHMRKGVSGPLLMRRLGVSGMEIKRPLTGDTRWINQSDPGASSIMMPKAPDGTVLKDLQPVWP
jgi:hypothetical protein